MPQGKVELLPTPADSSTGHLRYYARMAVPCSTSATGTTNIPWVPATDLYNAATGTSSTLYTVKVDSTANVYIGNSWTATGLKVTGGGTYDWAVDFSSTPAGIVYSIVDSTTMLVQPTAAFISVVVAEGIAGFTGMKNGVFSVGGDSTFLDIPNTYQDGILAMATWKFLLGIGAAPERIQYFGNLAQQELAKAQAAENEAEDDDFGFEPPTYSPNILMNPNVVISY